MSTVIKRRTTEDFLTKARAVARAADRGAPVSPQPKVISVEPGRFYALVTPSRLKVLKLIRQSGELAISELSAKLRRERSGVSRDVKALEQVGLVRTRMEANPGHGRHKVVASVAGKGEKVVVQMEI